jgi:putative sigma-54 modulation protein
LNAGTGRRVIKRSVLSIKPMSVEEAALQLEGSTNDFVVFKDALSEQVSVLYKRRDANYGLISPEF